MPEFIEDPLGGMGIMTNPFGIEYQHGGRDLAVAGGDGVAPVYAVIDGPLMLHPMGTWGDGSYGNAVKQATGDGWYSLSGHMAAYAADVYDGQIVKAGKHVGFQGHTGLTRPAGPGGSHVHWGLCSTPWFPVFNAETQGYFADPFAFLISEGERMAIFQRLDELERIIGQFTGGQADGTAQRMKAWVAGGNIGLIDCLGPQPSQLAQMTAEWPGIKEQTYGTNNLLHTWRMAAAGQGIQLP